MTPRSFLLTQELGDYVRASSERPDDVARDLLAETAALGERGEAPPTFQIPPEQGALMQLLTRGLGVRRASEVAPFPGFSALGVPRGLPADGRLVCLDTSQEWTAIARRYWERAGVADRIEVRLPGRAQAGRRAPARVAAPAPCRADVRPGLRRRGQGGLRRLRRPAAPPPEGRRPGPAG